MSILELKIPQAVFLKNAVAAIAEVNAHDGNKSYVHFTQAGLTFQFEAADNRVVAVLRLLSAGCDGYQCQSSPSFSFDFARLQEVMNQATEQDALTISVSGDKIKTMNFVFENQGTAGERRTFGMELTRCNCEIFDIPESLKAKSFEIPSEPFCNALTEIISDAGGKDMPPPSNAGPTAWIFVREGKMYIHGMQKRIILELENKEGGIFSGGDFNRRLGVVYRLRYFLKAALLSEKVWINKGDIPIALACPFGGDLGYVYLIEEY
ncbi:hypothetical protein SLEP1_g37652 [Rubroshorea leprosula]|uniref:Proliferating cell nuclear antigen PCNA N-terminal domain-containing protein n=1 Tax=Rubroshorea leprosula TaxID=152421 RepID=A0AAV5KVB8_9ROSI|nr:hypothetical protein SLEP1_g37652 [Rubroshorea leprosula]